MPHIAQRELCVGLLACLFVLQGACLPLAAADLPQWDNMVVIVTYDENGGFWDHAQRSRFDTVSRSSPYWSTNYSS
jgi:hypothetical protein